MSEIKEKKINYSFKQTIQKLKKEFGENLVNDYLGFIAASKKGMKEEEIESLIIKNNYQLDTTKSKITSSYFVHKLTPNMEYFIGKRQGLLTFLHSKFEWITKEEILSKNKMQHYHSLLASYFENRGIKDPRVLYELPYQYQMAKKEKKLLKILTDISFLQSKSQAKMIDDLINDFDRALTGISSGIKYTIEPEIEINYFTIQLLRKAIYMNRQFLRNQSNNLFQYLWNKFYWYDNPECSEYYVRNEENGKKKKTIFSYFKNSPKKNRNQKMPWELNNSKLYKLAKKWERDINSNKSILGTDYWLKAIYPTPPHLSEPIEQIFHGDIKAIKALQYSPDGKFIASCSDTSVKIWNIEKCICLFTLKGHISKIINISYSPDGKFLASCSYDETVRIWDTKQGICISIIKTLARIINISYNPDGKFVAFRSTDNTIKIWDYEKDCYVCILENIELSTTLSYSPNGKFIALSFLNGIIQIWDIAKKICIQSFRPYKSFINSLVYSPDGKFLAFTSFGNKGVRIYDIEKKTYINLDNCCKIDNLAYSSDGLFLATVESYCFDNSTVKIWDIKNKECILSFAHRIKGGIISVDYSPDDKFLATGSSDGVIRIWKICRNHNSFTLAGHKYDISILKYSPNGKLLASSSRGEIIEVWNSEKRICSSFSIQKYNLISCLIFSPDSKYIISGSRDYTIRIWNIEKETCICTLTGHMDRILSLSYSPNGRFIASISIDNSARIWDIKNKTCFSILSCHKSDIKSRIKRFLKKNFPIPSSRYGSYLQSLSYSPDGNLIATGAWDNKVRIWDVKKGICISTFTGHEEPVLSVTFSPDGKFVASGGATFDQTILIWDIVKGTCIANLVGHKGGVKYLSYSPDGKFLISASEAHELRIWDIESHKCLEIIECFSMPEIFAYAKERKLRVLSTEEKTIVQNPQGEEIAYFSIKINPKDTKFNGIAGTIGKDLCILKLCRP